MLIIVYFKRKCAGCQSRCWRSQHRDSRRRSRREPNADVVLFTFNSTWPMEKGRPGFPVESV